MTKFSFIKSISEADATDISSRLSNLHKDSGQLKSDDLGAGDEKSNDLLDSLIASVKNPGGGNSRVVIRTTVNVLKTNYLVAGGPKTMAGLLTPETAVILAQNSDDPGAAKSELQLEKQKLLPFELDVMPSNFNLTDMVKPSSSNFDIAILLDVPDDFISEFAQAGKSDDGSAAIASFTKMMNHRFYVFTIDIKKALSIASEVDAAFSNNEKLKEVFSPYIIIAHPDYDGPKFKQIKDFWFNTRGKQRDAEAEGDAPEDEDVVSSKPQVEQPTGSIDANEAFAEISKVWAKFAPSGIANAGAMNDELKRFIRKLFDQAHPASAAKFRDFIKTASHKRRR